MLFLGREGFVRPSSADCTISPGLLRLALGRHTANTTQLRSLELGVNVIPLSHIIPAQIPCLCLLSSLRKFLRGDGQGASDRLLLALEFKWNTKETPDGWTGFDVCTFYLPLLVPSGSSALRTQTAIHTYNRGSS